MATSVPIGFADITGDGAAHKVTASPTFLRALYVSATGGALRVGDSTVTATKGVNVAKDTMISLQELAQWTQDDTFAPFIDASTVYVFVPNGATASFFGLK